MCAMSVRKTMLAPVMFVAAVLGSGCQSAVETEVAVRSDGGAVVVVHVSFAGDIATKLESDAALRGQLEQTMRLSVAEIDIDAPGRSYTLRPTLSELEAATDLTGVGQVAVSSEGEALRVSVVTSRPERLIRAIETSVQGQPDAAQLAATMLTNTYLEVRIVFPGDVRDANGGVIDGRSVRYRDTLDRWASGTLVASGSSSGSSLPGLVVAALVVGAVVLGFAVGRKRR